MPRKRWIDKNNANTKTFQLVYRPQDDPLIHDESAQDRTLYQTSGPEAPHSASEPTPERFLHIADLEDQVDLGSVRENEGEAANYGIYFDDTGYDYMQHLREIGEGDGQAHFIDSMPSTSREKGKGRAKMVKLEEVLRQSSLDEDSPDNDHGISDMGSLDVTGDVRSTFSALTRPRRYQDMQDVPDEIAGFQPAMDPRLREALQALEDDEYVDEQDEDIFGQLTHGGQEAELDLHEFETMQADGEDDDGWESDATEKAPRQGTSANDQTPFLKAAPVDPMDISSAEAEAASAEDGDWLRNFAKFKKDNTAESAKKATGHAATAVARKSGVEAPGSALYTLGGTPLHRSRRKGALTNPSTYSMTSSSLARTDGQRLLDDRFDRIEALYALDDVGDGEDDGGMSLASGISKQSGMSAVSAKSFADGPVRSDLDGMMDGFLNDWSNRHPGGGKRNGAKGKRGKNGNEVLGIRMLDEVRQGLGPAKLRSQKA